MRMRVVVSFFLLSFVILAGEPEWERAHELYHRTEYRESLRVLSALPRKDSATLELIGQNYFMLGEYKKGTEVLEEAAAAEPENRPLLYWRGRSYTRRAASR